MPNPPRIYSQHADGSPAVRERDEPGCPSVVVLDDGCHVYEADTAVSIAVGLNRWALATGHGAEVLPAEVVDVVRRAAEMNFVGGDEVCVACGKRERVRDEPDSRHATDCAAIALRRLAATLGGK